jgi:hypothetical protein
MKLYGFYNKMKMMSMRNVLHNERNVLTGI